MNENKIENNQEFEPRIVAFVCNWCTYAGGRPDRYEQVEVCD